MELVVVGHNALYTCRDTWCIMHGSIFVPPMHYAHAADNNCEKSLKFIQQHSYSVYQFLFSKKPMLRSVGSMSIFSHWKLHVMLWALFKPRLIV